MQNAVTHFDDSPAATVAGRLGPTKEPVGDLGRERGVDAFRLGAKHSAKARTWKILSVIGRPVQKYVVGFPQPGLSVGGRIVNIPGGAGHRRYRSLYQDWPVKMKPQAKEENG